MKKSFIFTILGFSISLSAFCQGFDTLVEQGLKFFIQGDLQKFEEVYPKLYIEYLKENIPSYQEALNSIKNKDEDQAFHYLEELIDEDLFLDEIETDTNFETLHLNNNWLSFIHKIKAKKISYKETLRLELKEIQNQDQSIRLLYLNTKNDSLKTAIHNYMKTIDVNSAKKICAILDKYGWLGIEDVGSEGNETLFLVIQHVDDIKIQEKYLPMLQDAVKEGIAEGWHLAFLTDRILMNQGKKQIYGTQKIISKDKSKSYIIPLEYPDKVDELRNEVGLSSLKEELEEEGLNWDFEEYMKNLPQIEKMYKEWYDTVSKTL